MYGLLRQGDGKIVLTACFEEKMQTVRLPTINTPEEAWDFLEILFEELRCECFFEHAPPHGVKRLNLMDLMSIDCDSSLGSFLLLLMGYPC